MSFSMPKRGCPDALVDPACSKALIPIPLSEVSAKLVLFIYSGHNVLGEYGKAVPALR